MAKQKKFIPFNADLRWIEMINPLNDIFLVYDEQDNTFLFLADDEAKGPVAPVCFDSLDKAKTFKDTLEDKTSISSYRIVQFTESRTHG